MRESSITIAYIAASALKGRRDDEMRRMNAKYADASVKCVDAGVKYAT